MKLIKQNTDFCRYIYNGHIIGDFHRFVCAVHKNEVVMQEINYETMQDMSQSVVIVVLEDKEETHYFYKYSDLDEFYRMVN